MKKLTVPLAYVVTFFVSSTNQIRNQILIAPVLLPVMCNELEEPIAATCTKAHSARLHRWRVDDH